MSEQTGLPTLEAFEYPKEKLRDLYAAFSALRQANTRLAELGYADILEAISEYYNETLNDGSVYAPVAIEIGGVDYDLTIAIEEPVFSGSLLKGYVYDYDLNTTQYYVLIGESGRIVQVYGVEAR